MDAVDAVLRKIEQLVPRVGRILVVGDDIERYESGLARIGYAVEGLELCSGIGKKGFQMKVGLADNGASGDRQRLEDLPQLPEREYAAVPGVDTLDSYEKRRSCSESCLVL